jgi:hypothetical protein
MRRRSAKGMEVLQGSLFTSTAPAVSVPVAGYPRRVTDSMLRWLGPPHALSFDEAWERTMVELPAPIGWRGSGEPGEQSPVLFLRDRLLRAWEDDEALGFDRDDLAALFDFSTAARRGSSGARPARVVA